MKNKIIYVVTIILSLTIGVTGTIVTLHYFPMTEKTLEKTVNEVSISESDSLKTAIDKIYDSVVLIETYKNNRQISSGTGFVYKKDENNGYIITNHHVIDGATTVKVTNINGETVEAKVLGSDEYADIAVLSVDKSSILQVAQIGKSTDSNIGDTLFTIGSPLGSDYMGTVTKGILSGKERTVSVSLSSGSFLMEVLQTDAAINPGNSGGPLVNINGEVIGVNSIKLVQDEIEGMGFAIPIEMVMASVDRLEKGEKIVRPVIGVELLDVDNAYYLYRNGITLDNSIDSGVAIVNVQENSPAAASGLQKGDVILEVEGTQIKNVAYFRFVLYKYSVGDKIKIKYYRNNEILETEINLTKGLDE